MARRTTKTAGDSPESQASKLASEHGGLVALRGSSADQRGPADGHWFWHDEYLQADPTWWYRAGYVETAELAENRNLVVNGVNLRWYGPAAVWRFDPSRVTPRVVSSPGEPLWKSAPTFCTCGERLLLIAEGRTRCERCRVGAAVPVLPWSTTLSRTEDALDVWPEIPPPDADLEPEPTVLAVLPEPPAPPPPTTAEVADWVWRQIAHLYDR